MSFRNVVAGILALTLAGSAVVGLSLILRRHSHSSDVAITQVVIARMDIPLGVVISPNHVTTRFVLRTEVPEGALGHVNDVVGREAMRKLPKDAPILNEHVGPKG